MTQEVVTALIAGGCSIASAAIAAMITKYGWPFSRKTTLIRATGTASECYAIHPNGTFENEHCVYHYTISDAKLNVGKEQVSLSATLNTTKGEFRVVDAKLTGTGVFLNGVTYITYRVRDKRNCQEWYGLLLLRIPGIGDITGYWIADDHIKAGQFAMGSVCMRRT